MSRSGSSIDVIRPPEGSALLERLRGQTTARPTVDPGLAGGLRDWLEDGLAGVTDGLPVDAAPVRVTKEALTGVLMCEAHLMARRTSPRTVTVELARGSLVDALFRQWVTTGRLDDPWPDALGAVRADGDTDIIDFLEAMDAPNSRELAREVAEHAAGVVARWPVPSPTWLPRTQERLVVPLVGGRVVLSGVVDLAFGGPASERASVCVVEIKSGRRRVEHRGDLHFYALLETLRSGAPPFRIATYYTRTGELDVEPVTDDVLVGALQRVLAGTVRLCRLAAGTEPTRTPNGLCAWCAALPGCEPGQARAGTDVPRRVGDATTDDDFSLLAETDTGGGGGDDEQELEE
ncbi:MAG TPA: PD-(D/E)XK nuclease family protein [Acidimicrobiales bacterium]|nr:PD-(D/E)XK nuclease family protein [Acidimicrobiales bacterium]